jgi:hypothetical protein
LKNLKSDFISSKTTVTLYKTLIRPVMLYASETWCLTKTEDQILRTFERMILRKYFGPVKDFELKELVTFSKNHKLEP